MTSFNFLVDRKNLANTQLEAVPLAEIEEGEILVRIDKFALTANNITYAVAGDSSFRHARGGAEFQFGESAR